MRNLTKAAKDRNPSDLYRTPQNVIDRLCEYYRPIPSHIPLMVCDPCAGDGRIGLTVARALGCGALLQDINGTGVIQQADATQFKRPFTDCRVIVPINPPFNLLDKIASSIWSELKPLDELVILISVVSLANYSRPELWKELRIMPFHSVYDIRWRCPFEMPDGTTMKGAAMSHQWIRAIKGIEIEPGQTRQFDLPAPERKKGPRK